MGYYLDVQKRDSITPYQRDKTPIQKTYPLGDSLNVISEKLEVAALGVTAAKLAADAVETAKIKDANVTAAKLANAVADGVLTAMIAVAEHDTDDWNVTVQVKDIQGNNLAEVTPVDIYLSDTAAGALAATGVTSESATTGTLIASITAHKLFKCLTDNTGKLVLNLVEAAALSVYANAIVGGKLYTSEQIIFAAPESSS